MFIEYATKDPYFFFSWILIITFSICFHEFAHAQTALWKGDDTAARQGHLSLNPLVQMGWSSLIMLAMVGIAWGAVPVDTRRLRGPSAHAQVALAGPLANLLLCLILAVASGLAETMGMSPEIRSFLKMAAMANGVLFLFNLIPIPMFDGWTVLAFLIPALRRVNLQHVAGFSWMILIVIWTTGIMSGIWQLGATMERHIRSWVVLLIHQTGTF